MDFSIFVVLLLFVVHLNVVLAGFHEIKKRSMDIELCIDRFDIHSNKIIRTEESINMGAKFIADVELMSHDQCLRLCCETEGCNVFVYEEKIRGTCFLFECGPSENFRCKFTEHSNYTSAILDLRRPLTPVTEVHPISVHELALNKLKRPTTTTSTTTTVKPVQIAPKTTVSSIKNVQGNCKRFEFECHTPGIEGGCIAIYNVCNGIPQCEDASDETDCPPEMVASNKNQGYPQPILTEGGLKIKQYQLPENTNNNAMQVQQQVQNQIPIIQNTNNREDPLTSPKFGWQSQQGSNENIQYHDTESHIFNHKNGLHVPATNIIQQPNYAVDRMREGYPIQLAPETMYQTQNQQQQQTNGQWIPETPHRNTWQQQQQPPMIPQVMSGIQQNLQSPQTQNGKVNFGQIPGQTPGVWVPVRQDAVQDTQRQSSIVAQVPVANVVPSNGDESNQKSVSSDVSKETNSSSDSKGSEEDEGEEDTDSDVTTEAPKKQRKHKKPKQESKAKSKHDDEAHHEKLLKAQYAHVKNQLDMEFADHDGYSDRPSGAVISLTLGIIILIALVILISCRFRGVTRRMRRLPKGAGYDADFLVNGMYL
ncbi:uncharacterized protein LOC134831510 [Culicoides brevitarsis]|uniref:uncharacterized protein LOC134831510 n=1 Tax=Culicoides brevitarsis TaxID=469753 RepID=UPI00307C95D6